MRFLSADYIFPLNESPIKKGVIQIDLSGRIINVFKDNDKIKPKDIEFFNGILCPGFINAHCHLELSYLKQDTFIDKAEGIVQFIDKMRKKPKYSEAIISQKIEAAESEMIKEGIVGVADICNTKNTIFQKKRKNIRYTNFIETYQVDEKKSDIAINNSLRLQKLFESNGLNAIITPHSPYSVTTSLLKKISNLLRKSDNVITFHNQESLTENELFRDKSGDLFDWLKSIGASKEILNNTNHSPLMAVLKNIPFKKNILLVHNTFTKKEDLLECSEYHNRIYWCTCPRSNINIENTIPDYNLFNKDRICIGTDSLASNKSLSILDELKVLSNKTNFSLNDMLNMACKNGANALGYSDLGTLEKNKKPGINLLNKIKNQKITKKTTITRIV
tara:strand:- start:161 stop:1330 length:1170 start_codon:yes stop_codon:yes gene_type:complete